MHSDQQIAAFDEAHGTGSYERCMAAARRVVRASRTITVGDVHQFKLEREGIPSDLAAAFVALLRPPIQSTGRLRGARARRFEKADRRHA